MAKVHPYQNDKIGIYMYVFFCPGCKFDHPFAVKQYRDTPNPVWTFNGDVNKPTFTPSLLVNKSLPEQRCHLIMTDGNIYFCSDSHHELANKTVECPEYEEN
jgi:hypothetical protein